MGEGEGGEEGREVGRGRGGACRVGRRRRGISKRRPSEMVVVGGVENEEGNEEESSLG